MLGIVVHSVHPSFKYVCCGFLQLRRKYLQPPHLMLRTNIATIEIPLPLAHFLRIVFVSEELKQNHDILVRGHATLFFQNLGQKYLHIHSCECKVRYLQLRHLLAQIMSSYQNAMMLLNDMLRKTTFWSHFRAHFFQEC